MSFWYHMKGAHIGALNVYQENRGASSKTLIWSLNTATAQDKWYNGQLPLTPSGNLQYRVRVFLCLHKLHKHNNNINVYALFGKVNVM